MVIVTPDAREELVLVPFARDDERGLLVAVRKVGAPGELNVVEGREKLQPRFRVSMASEARHSAGIDARSS